jgi:hypothetical protein
VIQPVDSPTSSDDTRVRASGSSAKSFAKLLDAHEKPAALPTIPDGETWQSIAGHRSYAKIISGPRRGSYINLTLGPRHGETFKIEHRGGKTLHVYASGATVGARTDMPQLSHAATVDQPPKGEIWAPVPGTTAWADILGGPRDGLFVNTSGNSRQGMAFQIVHRGGKTYHMYGSGRHRLMVEVRDSPHHHKQPVGGGAAPSAPASADASGGISPPS